MELTNTTTTTGTNDAKKHHWNETLYREDYLSLMKVYLTMPTRPLLYVCIPPPIYSTRPVFHISPHVVNVRFPIIIPEIAAIAATTAMAMMNGTSSAQSNVTTTLLPSQITQSKMVRNNNTRNNNNTSLFPSPPRVQIIDNFHLLGGGKIHSTFNPAYLVNPNISLGKYPNDLCHLSDHGYAQIALHVFHKVLKDVLSMVLDVCEENKDTVCWQHLPYYVSRAAANLTTVI